MIAAAAAAVFRYLDNLLECTDMWCAALIPGGRRKETISLRAARARQRLEEWGCILCAWLAFTSRTNHCQQVLKKRSVRGFAAFILGAQILLLWFAIVYLLFPYLFHEARGI